MAWTHSVGVGVRLASICLEALRPNALGFRNLTVFGIRSTLYCGALAL